MKNFFILLLLLLMVGCLKPSQSIKSELLPSLLQLAKTLPQGVTSNSVGTGSPDQPHQISVQGSKLDLSALIASKHGPAALSYHVIDPGQSGLTTSKLDSPTLHISNNTTLLVRVSAGKDQLHLRLSLFAPLAVASRWPLDTVLNQNGGDGSTPEKAVRVLGAVPGRPLALNQLVMGGRELSYTYEEKMSTLARVVLPASPMQAQTAVEFTAAATGSLLLSISDNTASKLYFHISFSDTSAMKLPDDRSLTHLGVESGRESGSDASSARRISGVGTRLELRRLVRYPAGLLSYQKVGGDMEVLLPQGRQSVHSTALVGLPHTGTLLLSISDDTTTLYFRILAGGAPLRKGTPQGVSLSDDSGKSPSEAITVSGLTPGAGLDLSSLVEVIVTGNNAYARYSVLQASESSGVAVGMVTDTPPLIKPSGVGELLALITSAADEVAEKSLYFRILVRKRANTLSPASHEVKGLSWGRNEGIERGKRVENAIEVTVQKDLPLNLSDLVQGGVGELSFILSQQSLDLNEGASEPLLAGTAPRPQLKAGAALRPQLKVDQASPPAGSYHINAGQVLLKASSAGDAITEPQELYFSIHFSPNSNPLARKSNWQNLAGVSSGESRGNGSGETAAQAIGVTVTGDTSLRLNDLVQNVGDKLEFHLLESIALANGGRLASGKFSATTQLKIAPGSGDNEVYHLKSGTVVQLKARDPGSDTVAAKEIYFRIDFMQSANSMAPRSSWSSGLGLSSARSLGNGSGEDVSDAIGIAVAGDSLLTLRDLVQEGAGELSFSLAQALLTLSNGTTLYYGDALSHMKVGSGLDASVHYLPAATVLLRARAAGGENIAAKTLFFSVTFAKNSASLVRAHSAPPGFTLANQSGEDLSHAIEVEGLRAYGSLDLRSLVEGINPFDTVSYSVEDAGSSELAPGPVHGGRMSPAAVGRALISITHSSASHESKTLFFAVQIGKRLNPMNRRANWAGVTGVRDGRGLGNQQGGAADHAIGIEVAADTTLTFSKLVQEAVGPLLFNLVQEDLPEDSVLPQWELLSKIKLAQSAPEVVELMNAGSILIKARAEGDRKTEAGELFFKIKFSKNSNPLAPRSDWTEVTGVSAVGNQEKNWGADPASAISLQVAPGTTLVLENLVRHAVGPLRFESVSLIPLADVRSFLEQGTLLLQLAARAAEAAAERNGQIHYVNSDAPFVVKAVAQGDTRTLSKELFFSLTFASSAAKSPNTLAKRDLLTTGGVSHDNAGGSGESRDNAIGVVVAADTTLTLSELVSGGSGPFRFSLAQSSLTLANGNTLSQGDTLPKQLRVVSAAGCESSSLGCIAVGSLVIQAHSAGTLAVASRDLYFRIDFAKNSNSVLQRGNPTGYQLGQESGAEQSSAISVSGLRVGATLNLADLVGEMSAEAHADTRYRIISSSAEGVESSTTAAKPASIRASSSGELLLQVTHGTSTIADKSLFFRISIAKKLNLLTVRSQDLPPGVSVSATGNDGSKDGSSEAQAVSVTLASDTTLSLASLVEHQVGELSFSLAQHSLQMANGSTLTRGAALLEKLKVASSAPDDSTQHLPSGSILVRINAAGNKITETGARYFHITLLKNHSQMQPDLQQKAGISFITGSRELGESEDHPINLSVTGSTTLHLSSLVKNAKNPAFYTQEPFILASSEIYPAATQIPSEGLRVSRESEALTAPLAWNIQAGTYRLRAYDSSDAYQHEKSLFFRITFSKNPNPMISRSNDGSNPHNDGSRTSRAINMDISSSGPFSLTSLVKEQLGPLNFVLAQAKLRVSHSDRSWSLPAGAALSEQLQLGTGSQAGITYINDTRVLLQVSSPGDPLTEPKNLYFQLRFTNKDNTFALTPPSSWAHGLRRGEASGDGLSSTTPVVVQVASDTTLRLSDLVQQAVGPVVFHAQSRELLRDYNAPQVAERGFLLRAQLKMGPGNDALTHYVNPGRLVVTAAAQGLSMDAENLINGKTFYFHLYFSPYPNPMVKGSPAGVSIDQQSGDAPASAMSVTGLTVGTMLDLSSLVSSVAGLNLGYRVLNPGQTQLVAGQLSSSRISLASPGTAIISISSSSATTSLKELFFSVQVDKRPSSLSKVASLVGYSLGSESGSSQDDAIRVRGLKVDQPLDVSNLVVNLAQDSGATTVSVESSTVTGLAPGALISTRITPASTGVVGLKISHVSATTAEKSLFFQIEVAKKDNALGLRPSLPPGVTHDLGSATGASPAQPISLRVQNSTALDLSELVQGGTGSLVFSLAQSLTLSSGSVLEYGTKLERRLQVGRGTDNSILYLETVLLLVKARAEGNDRVAAQDLYLSIFFEKKPNTMIKKGSLTEIDGISYGGHLGSGDGSSPENAIGIQVSSGMTLYLPNLVENKVGNLYFSPVGSLSLAGGEILSPDHLLRQNLSAAISSDPLYTHYLKPGSVRIRARASGNELFAPGELYFNLNFESNNQAPIAPQSSP